MGFSDKELQATSASFSHGIMHSMQHVTCRTGARSCQAVLSWIQDLAPVIIHVNIDTVGRFLESDEYYRRSFQGPHRKTLI